MRDQKKSKATDIETKAGASLFRFRRGYRKTAQKPVCPTAKCDIFAVSCFLTVKIYLYGFKVVLKTVYKGSYFVQVK